MKKASFPIWTSGGSLLAEGYTSEFIGIHREEKSDPWTVTLLATGTKIDSIFPQRFNSRAVLAGRIEFIENIAWECFAALSDLPYGADKFPPSHRPTADALVAIVKANP